MHIIYLKTYSHDMHKLSQASSLLLLGVSVVKLYTVCIYIYGVFVFFDKVPHVLFSQF